MIDQGIKKHIMNPCLGLMPFLLYFILYVCTEDVSSSLMISSLVAVVFGIIQNRWLNAVLKCGLMFAISFASLVLTLIVWLITINLNVSDQLYLVIPEVIAVFLFSLVQLSKVYLNIHFFKKQTSSQRIFTTEFYEIVRLTQFFFTFHLFLTLIYTLLTEEFVGDNVFNSTIFVWIPVAGLSAIILYEYVKVAIVSRKLKKEEWIPIVNEQGEVSGKIAKSLSHKMKERNLHPIVRIALIYDGKIYLQQRKSTDILDPLYLDYPFEKYILYNHDVNLAANNCVNNVLGYELPLQFLLKYTFENEKVKNLVFLFVARIDNEKLLGNTENLTGKFWTPKLIEADMGDTSKFSECFQLEYEYLKNTVLIADEIVKNSPQ